MGVFQDVLFPDRYSILAELLTALYDRKKFDWEALLGFIHELLALEHFWTEQEVNGSKYRNQILADTAELIVVGTNDDDCAFDPEFLPLAEQILLILAEKAESSRIIQEDPYSTFLNSSKGMVFWAMMKYTLRVARIKNTKGMDFRWPQAIRADFTKRLDKSIECSFEFSFALGAFLSELLYFDKKWVIDNINCIFSMPDEHHWYVTFSAYLLSSDQIHEFLGFLLKEGGHYQKALSTNFAHHTVETALARHICMFWLENGEALNDKTGLIYQVRSCPCAFEKCSIVIGSLFGMSSSSVRICPNRLTRTGCPVVCLWIDSMTAGAKGCPTSSVYWERSSRTWASVKFGNLNSSWILKGEIKRS